MPLTQTNVKTFVSTASAASHAVSLGFTATVGRLIVVCVNSDTTLGSPPVADNIDTAGANWSLATSGTNFTLTAIYYKLAQGSETTVTVKLSASDSLDADMREYSGNAASSVLDIANSATGSSTAPATPSVTTTNADDLVVVCFGEGSGASANPWLSTPPSGYTTLSSLDSTGSAVNAYMYTASKAVSSTGAQSAAVTTGGSNAWVACIAAFKAAAATGPFPLPRPWIGRPWTRPVLAR